MRAVAGVLVALLAVAAAASPPGDDAMRDAFDGSHRVLLVFGPPADPRAARFDAALEEARCRLVDRDLVVIRLPAGAAATVDGATVDAASATRLRERYGVDDGTFAVILVGKDGGEKARYPEVPALGRVFALIDGMPMRRAEMRGQASSCGS